MNFYPTCVKMFGTKVKMWNSLIFRHDILFYTSKLWHGRNEQCQQSLRLADQGLIDLLINTLFPCILGLFHLKTPGGVGLKIIKITGGVGVSRDRNNSNYRWGGGVQHPPLQLIN